MKLPHSLGSILLSILLLFGIGLTTVPLLISATASPALVTPPSGPDASSGPVPSVPPIVSTGSPGQLGKVAVTSGPGDLGAALAPLPGIVTDSSQSSGQFTAYNVSQFSEDYTVSVVDYSINPDGTKTFPSDPGSIRSASWYTIERPNFTLPSGTSMIGNFSITVPADATPGDHLAALVVYVQKSADSAPTPTRSDGDLTLKGAYEIVIRLQHRVAGGVTKTPTAQLTAHVEGDGTRFRVSIANGGTNVISYEDGANLPSIQLYSNLPWADQSKVDKTVEMKGFYVAPGNIYPVTTLWSTMPLIGSYRAVLTLPGHDGMATVTAETTFVIINYMLLIPFVIGLGLILVVLVTLIARFFIRRRRNSVKRDKAGRPEFGQSG